MNALTHSPTAAGAFTRQDVRFDSGETYCSAWLYLPAGVERPPVVVLGHGLGAIREMRLDAFSERFAAAGIATLAFTYRYFGDSGGEPRQLMSVKRQLADWEVRATGVGPDTLPDPAPVRPLLSGSERPSPVDFLE